MEAAVSEVSVLLARDMFELAGFLVQLNRKYAGNPEESSEVAADLYILNPRPRQEGTPPGVVLGAADLSYLERASVKVRGWHTDSFATARLASGSGIFDFVEESALAAAKRYFRNAPFEKVLVLSRLPARRDAREASIRLLKGRGVDRVVEFTTVLKALVDGVKVNKKYVGDDLLEVIRTLKSYKLFAGPQMDLFRKARK